MTLAAGDGCALQCASGAEGDFGGTGYTFFPSRVIHVSLNALTDIVDWCGHVLFGVAGVTVFAILCATVASIDLGCTELALFGVINPESISTHDTVSIEALETVGDVTGFTDFGSCGIFCQVAPSWTLRIVIKTFLIILLTVVGDKLSSRVLWHGYDCDWWLFCFFILT